MYSRTERKFLTPDADHANPNLGPGCYTHDQVMLFAGKVVGDEGYAPFACLTPRISHFDTTIHPGPAPGSYSPPVVRPPPKHHAHAPLFGKSRATRFKGAGTFTPGPGTYKVESRLGRKSKKRQEHDVEGRLEVGSRTHPLGKVPVGGVEGGRRGVEREEGGESGEVRDGAASARGIGVFGKGRSVKGRKERTIVWRRKYVPPSIPVGRYAFGYQETKEGDLIPRKPPQSAPD
ncbi:Sperm-tail PG-rich repeat-containing protein 2, partial [Rhizophlyctis rosea]